MIAFFHTTVAPKKFQYYRLVSINAKNVVITFVKALRLEYFSKDVLTDLIPSAFGVMVYNDCTSTEARYQLFGTKSI